jgi:antitoxin (DNA-binding transcriptional repressor) of toxin-antitoxin stability system
MTSEVNRRLGEILEAVGKGESIELVRYGRVVAVLTPPRAVTAQPEKKSPPMTVDDILKRSRRGDR